MVKLKAEKPAKFRFGKGDDARAECYVDPNGKRCILTTIYGKEDNAKKISRLSLWLSKAARWVNDK